MSHRCRGCGSGERGYDATGGEGDVADRSKDEMGRTLVIAGLVLVAVGLMVMLLGRLGLPLGKLPGDISYRGKHDTVFAPIGTCLLLSLVLTLVMWVIGHWRR